MRKAIISIPVLLLLAAGCAIGDAEPSAASDADWTLLPRPPLPPVFPTCSLRAEPRVLIDRSSPSIDPSTCVDRTPKVALVRVNQLPLRLRNVLVAGGARGPFAMSDQILLYVPGADAGGRRVLELSDTTADTLDPCPARVTKGHPTEEKCPAPSAADVERSATKLPGGTATTAISLASTQIAGKLATGASVEKYRGVLVVADQVNLTGTVRTRGNDLFIVAETVHVNGSSAGIDMSPPRAPSGLGAIAAGKLVVAAGTVEGGTLGLYSVGGAGPLPRSTNGGITVHYDCDAYVNGNPAAVSNPGCWPCGGTATPFETPDDGAFTFWAKPSDKRCASVAYPAPPAGFPDSFYTKAPSGSPGGSAGEIAVLADTTAAPVLFNRNTGRGSHGLERYQLHWDDWSNCGSTPWCVGTDRWLEVPAGDSFDGLVCTPNGCSQTASSGSITYRNTGTPSDFTGGARDVTTMMAWIADELLAPSARIAAADAKYRAGDSAGARALYDQALASLGTNADEFPCTLANQYASLSARAHGEIAQIDAGLDFGGLAPTVAPFKSPTALEPIVKSELAHVTSVATDLNLKALLAYASTSQAAAIGANMNAADGDLADKEAAVNAYALAEKQARVAELQTYAGAADADLSSLTKRYEMYLSSKAVSPLSDIFSKIKDVATKAVAVGKDIAGLVASSGATAFIGGAAGTASDAADLYSSLDKLFSAPTPFDCNADLTCLAFKNDIVQAKARAAAIQQAATGAKIAVAGQQAASSLFEARRQASRDVARTLASSGFTVDDPSKLPRAAKYLCEYGGYLADEAARTLYEFQRASALWDVPSPTEDATLYGGSGGKYSFGFAPLFDSSCTPPACSLWGTLDAFEKARSGPPNLATLYLGTADVPTAQRIGALLRAAPASSDKRVAIELGLFRDSSQLRFGVRPALGARPVGADGTIFDGASTFGTKWAVQLLGLQVHARASDGSPVRATFPFRLSRPASDTFVSDLASGHTISFAMQKLPTLELDGGRWLTRPTATTDGGFDFRIVDVHTPAESVEHPESLMKTWTLWVPVCGAGESPSAACATSAEIAAIDRLEITAPIRYKVGP